MFKKEQFESVSKLSTRNNIYHLLILCFEASGESSASPESPVIAPFTDVLSRSARPGLDLHVGDYLKSHINYRQKYDGF